MKPTVLLFDIDGTLITTGGVGRVALEESFQKLYGGGRRYLTFPLDGMTDRGIVRGGLAGIGHSPTAEEIDAVLDTYIALLEEKVAGADAKSYRVHRGMHEAVAAATDAGCAVGLGTGNIRAGARVKLSRVGLYDRFSFGGFGCDHEDRTALIRRGAERGAEKLGVPLEECRVIVIGDTPKDVAAAKGIGAECIGVGTGAFTPAQLIEAGAIQAFADFSAAGAIESVVSPSRP